MFGFGKAKSKPAPSKPEEPKLVRFYGYYNSLCQMGKPPWPPMLRNDSYHNLTEMFQITERQAPLHLPTHENGRVGRGV